MEFDDIRAFVTVVDTGSVSHAARELNVTQSAVTRRLQRLETSLGTNLLDRGTRPVTLTATGQAALERCRRLLNEAREIRAVTNGVLPGGEIRIGVAHALTELTLTEPVRRVRSKFPDVALRLRTGWSRELLERVRSGAIDAAVILLPENERMPAEVMGAPIAKDELLVVTGKAGKNFPRRIEDLAGAQWILNPEGCAGRAALRRALLRANIDMVVAVEAYNYELQLVLVSQNRGLSLVPARILKRSRVRSRVRVLRVPGLHFPLAVWIVYRHSYTGLDQVISELTRVLSEKF